MKTHKPKSPSFRERFDNRFYTMNKVHPPFGEIKDFIEQELILLLDRVNKEVIGEDEATGIMRTDTDGSVFVETDGRVLACNKIRKKQRQSLAIIKKEYEYKNRPSR